MRVECNNKNKAVEGQKTGIWLIVVYIYIRTWILPKEEETKPDLLL